jgi:hypothetical protein
LCEKCRGLLACQIDEEPESVVKSMICVDNDERAGSSQQHDNRILSRRRRNYLPVNGTSQLMARVVTNAKLGLNAAQISYEASDDGSVSPSFASTGICVCRSALVISSCRSFVSSLSFTMNLSIGAPLPIRAQILGRLGLPRLPLSRASLDRTLQAEEQLFARLY